MNTRTFLGAMGLALSLSGSMAPEAVLAAAAAPIDVEARKASQAWVWTTPQRATIPTVGNARWPLDPVDSFILRRLEQSGLSPSGRADDSTWLRRVHFAITGLPPSRETQHQFAKDPDPGKRGKVVDQLLASPHFGERWARHWMDLMRYAESRGHESDYAIANAWQYRDYLIRAFNSDVPYNRFLEEHLAGDLLPEPRKREGTEINESVLGTGWAFLGEEVHSPVDIRQDECERLDNKLDVFTKSFLGLTVSCARCHDHKFDPIRTQDYYALTGFLLGSSYRQVRFEAMENNRRMAEELAALRKQSLPILARRVGEANREGIGEIPRYLEAARQVLEEAGAISPEALEDAAAWSKLSSHRLGRWIAHLRTISVDPFDPLYQFAKAIVPKQVQPTNSLPALAAFRLPEGARVVADFTRAGVQPWKVDGEAFGRGPIGVGECVPSLEIGQPIARILPWGAARRDPFWNRLRTAPGNENDSGQLAATSRSGQMLRTPTITLTTGRLHYLIRGRTRVYAAVDSHLMVEGPLHGSLMRTFDTGASEVPQWVTQDLATYSGHRTHVEFGPVGDSGLEILKVVESTEVPRGIPGIDPNSAPWAGTSTSNFARAFQSVVAEANGRLETGGLSGSPEAARLADWLVRHPDLLRDLPEPSLVAAAKDFQASEQALAGRVQWESRTAVSWFDGTGVDENVLVRGKPFKTGPTAPRSLPAAFASARPITPSESSGRLELARQLSAPENPLIARAIVNRVWHHLFGRGIVASVDNFGALGDRPTHPELLDHLAWQFVHEDNWSLKRLVRRLVLTQTFAMDSRSRDPRAAEVDPSNTLLHHMPIRRLEAEAIRDSLLAVSGRLNPAVGGPPVPVHLTEFIVGRGRPDQSGPLDGDGRRSVYTAVRRNFLPTTMLTFDSPTPFSTVGRRNVTNVPAQYLALMNDELFHQQSRVWAERLLRETAGLDVPTRIRWLFETAYARVPDASESAACVESLAEFRQCRAAGAPEIEGWTDLCHALLNANDFIYLR